MSSTILTDQLATNSVRSQDGTTIGYYQLGKGPGIILVHGGMESAASHMDLAQMLATDFTVYLPDRRGRGLSGPFGSTYSLQTEVEDIKALVDKTGAEYLFGLSSGAIICLQAALRLPAIKKVAIYEPPLSINGSFPVDWVEPFGQKIASGDTLNAFILAAKATQQFGYKLPVWLLKLLAKVLLKDMLKLTPTFRYDAQLVVETKDKWESFKDIKAAVLLIGGGHSPAFLAKALDELEKILPNVKRMTFPKLNHGGSGNRNRGGQPHIVAETLEKFYHS